MSAAMIAALNLQRVSSNIIIRKKRLRGPSCPLCKGFIHKDCKLCQGNPKPKGIKK